MHTIVKRVHQNNSGPLCHLCNQIIPCEHFTLSAIKHTIEAVENIDVSRAIDKIEHIEQVATSVLNDDEIKNEMKIVEDKHDKTMERLQALAKIMEELEKDDIISIAK